MTRNKLAVLSIAALALLAMSAVLAAGAHATNESPEFTCMEVDNQAPVHCTALAHQVEAHRAETNGKHIFKAGIAAVICNSATFDITTFDGSTSTPEATPTYSECEDSVSHNPAHVNHNGCEYRFHIQETSGETVSEDEYKGTVDIVCPTGPIIVQITNGSGGVKCTIEIGAQNGLTGVYFRNHTSASPTDGTVEAFEVAANATFTGGFFNCGVTNGVHPTKYTGNTTVEATNTLNEKIAGHID